MLTLVFPILARMEEGVYSLGQRRTATVLQVSQETDAKQGRLSLTSLTLAVLTRVRTEELAR